MPRTSTSMRLAFLFLALFASGCVEPPGPDPAATPPPRPLAEASTMDDKALKNLFAAGNSSAVMDWAAAEGPPAVSRLEPFLASTDREQRLLAAESIALAGGPPAATVQLRLLDDSDEQIAHGAAVALHKNLPNGQGERLTKVLTTHRDPFIRRHAALLLGEIEYADTLRWLDHHARGETDGDVRDAIVAAKAKLADPQGRQAFTRMLAEADGPRSKELIDLSEYINQPWLVKALRPMVAKEGIAVDLSSHRNKLTRRACDLAIDEIARLTGHEFTFPISKAANYTLVQRQEVEKIVDGWSG